MSDEQLSRRLSIKRMFRVALVLLLLSGGMLYYKFATEEAYLNYSQTKAQEPSVQSKIDQQSAENARLTQIIDETGKELVSFTDDKIKYINLASELSHKYELTINKLVVSDVWRESQMSVMTAVVEVEGYMDNITAFVSEYCGRNYTNRINSISCRPVKEYTWLVRNIDGEKVLGWFDLTVEEELFKQFQEERNPLTRPNESPVSLSEGEEEKVEDERVISLSSMFQEQKIKVYLEIDFLGRE